MSATFDVPVDGADPATVPVHGFQSGRAFLGEALGGDGTETITTPAGSFFPGEEVEVVVTPFFGCPGLVPTVARYRVASVAATADFIEAGGSPFAVGDPLSVAIGDLDGDGRLDLAVANVGSDDVTILLNGAA